MASCYFHSVSVDGALTPPPNGPPCPGQISSNPPPLAAPRVNFLQPKPHLVSLVLTTSLCSSRIKSQLVSLMRTVFSITSLFSQVTRSVQITLAAPHLQAHHFISLSLTSGGVVKGSESQGGDWGPVWCKDGVRVLCLSPQRAVLPVWAWVWLDPKEQGALSLIHMAGLLWGLLPSCSIHQTFSIDRPASLPWDDGWSLEVSSSLHMPLPNSPGWGALSHHEVVTKRSSWGHTL